jgi:MFS family permease
MSRKIINSSSYHCKTMASAALRTRCAVIGFAVALAVITSIDRVVLSLSRGRIASDLHLTDAEMGLVFSACATAYAICEIPSGHLGDRSGPAAVLIAIWWAVFMGATARAFSFISLCLTLTNLIMYILI